jgi:competence protein ComEC
MRSVIIGFVLGVIFLQTQAVLPASTIMYCMLAAVAAWGLLLRWLTDHWVTPRVKIPVLVAGGMLCGFLWAGWMAQGYLAQALPKAAEGENITVIGVIDSLPYQFEQGVRFNFAVEQVLDARPGISVPPRIALGWYGASHGEQVQPVGAVQPGERWQLTVRLQRPHGNANPDGFDYEVWLLEQRLRATGYVRPDAELPRKNQRLTPFVVSFSNVVEYCRNHLRARILAALPGRPYAGVLVALVVGDQRVVNQADWTIFNRSGIGHLISISGLHITMIAGLFAQLMFALWRRSFFTGAQLPLILPAQKAAALTGVAVAWLYVLLAGFGVPAQRTLYMLAVVGVALWCGRIASVSHVLCAALGLVLLLDPWAVLWPGFWLSFGAVAIILYASVGRTVRHSAEAPSARARWLAVLKEASATQYVVTLGLVPLTLLLFGQVSLISPLANAVAIPLVSLVVTPLALLGSVAPGPLCGWLLQLAHWLVQLLAQGLTWLSASPLALWSAPLPPFWMFLLALLGVLWMLAPRGWPLRWLGLVGAVPLLLNAPAHPAAGQMWVTALDVGQGMALLIETEHHRLLYDTGPSYSPESDGGNRVIVPYLKARGIAALDAMIVTHNDNDHSGGALSVLANIRVGSVTSSLKAASPIVRAAPGHRRCEAGQGWSWDGVQFEMLHPTAQSYDSDKWKPNARGCTLKLTLTGPSGLSMLLPADIEALQEDELLGRSLDKLRATVLLAPHHGSGTSSTEPFLRAVQPQLALFQVGYRNRYHHPKADVFERYGKLGIERLRTDESGAITVRFGAALAVEEYRTTHARYWYGQ